MNHGGPEAAREAGGLLSIKCPSCGAENSDTAEFCTLCLASVGFEAPPPAAEDTEGFLTRYPSSFDAQVPDYRDEPWADQPRPDAPPVDIGQYGVRTGHPHDGGLDQTSGPGPGYGGGDEVAPGEAWRQGYRGAYPERERAYGFDWARTVYSCAGMAGFATLVSVGLELALSFVGYGLAYQGRLTGAMLVILVSFLVPVAVAGFGAGYRLEENGWLVGLLSVAIWAFLFRPLYYALLSWMLTDRFSFSALFNAYSLAFILGLFLPLGALLGWLGQKRATTGLSF